jgi:superfamily II DNA helicase RecQ
VKDRLRNISNSAATFKKYFSFFQLRKKGLPCKAYHAGLKDGERSSVQEDFMDGKISVIVATVSFGMGVDKASVRGVVHWCAPQNVAAYYQVSIFRTFLFAK